LACAAYRAIVGALSADQTEAAMTLALALTAQLFSHACSAARHAQNLQQLLVEFAGRGNRRIASFVTHYGQ